MYLKLLSSSSYFQAQNTPKMLHRQINWLNGISLQVQFRRVMRVQCLDFFIGVVIVIEIEYGVFFINGETHECMSRVLSIRIGNHVDWKESEKWFGFFSHIFGCSCCGTFDGVDSFPIEDHIHSKWPINSYSSANERTNEWFFYTRYANWIVNRVMFSPSSTPSCLFAMSTVVAFFFSFFFVFAQYIEPLIMHYSGKNSHKSDGVLSCKKWLNTYKTNDIQCNKSIMGL